MPEYRIANPHTRKTFAETILTEPEDPDSHAACLAEDDGWHVIEVADGHVFVEDTWSPSEWASLMPGTIPADPDPRTLEVDGDQLQGDLPSVAECDRIADREAARRR